jgi:hypothetical protein
MKDILKSLMVYKEFIHSANLVIEKQNRRDVLTYNSYLAPNEFSNVIFGVENELIANLLDPYPEEPELVKIVRNSLYSFCNDYMKSYYHNKKNNKPFKHPNITIEENYEKNINPLNISGRKIKATNLFTSKQTTSVKNILHAISISNIACIDLAIFDLNKNIEPISHVELSLINNIVTTFFKNDGFVDKATGKFIDIENKDVIHCSHTFTSLTQQEEIKNIPQLRRDIENREVTFPIVSKIAEILELYLKEYYKYKF